jgi:hypothetical protein
VTLLEETIQCIEASGHTPADVVFIGSRESGYRCTWEEFTTLADVRYDAGYGSAKVAQDLEVVFGDGSGMWRSDYDGKERWEFWEPFVEPADSKPIVRLTVEGTNFGGWATLAELHGEDPIW